MSPSQSRIAVGFIGQSAGLLLALTYLTFFAGFTSGWLNPVLLTLLAVACLLMGAAAARGLELPALTFVAVLLLTSFTSLDPSRSLVQTWQIAAGLFLVLALAGLVGRGLDARRVMGVVLLLGGVYMLLGWLDAARWYRAWLALYPGQWLPSISFRLNGSNVVAAYLNILIFLAVPRTLSAARRPARLGWGIYALSGLGLLFLTSSRGGWVAAIAGAAALVLIFYRRPLWQLLRAGWRRPVFRRFIFPAGALAVVSGVGLVLAWYLRSAGSHPTHGSFWISRNEFWGPALAAFARSPLLGVGPGTFFSLYAASRPVPPNQIFLHAHNQVLDILSGSGLLGLAAFAWLLFAAGRALLSRWRQSSPAERPLITGACAALITYLAHGLFDGVYRMPFASFSLIAVLGAALGSADSSTPRRLRSLTPWLGLLAAAYGLFNAWQLTPLQAGVQALDAGNLPRAVTQLEEAARRSPGMAAAWQQLGLARSQQALTDSSALPGAVAAFEQAARLDPTFGAHFASLAALYRAGGDWSATESAARQAVQRAPGEASYWLLLGEISEARGENETARQAYRAALELDPPWAESSAYWQASPTRLLAWRGRIARQPAALPADENAAVHQPYALPMMRLAAVYRQRGDLATAGRLLGAAQLAYFAAPTDRLELLWQQAELAAAQGDLPTARRLSAQALDGWLHPGLFGPGSAGQSLYGPGVFRAPASRLELPAQLTLPLPDVWRERVGRQW